MREVMLAVVVAVASFWAGLVVQHAIEAHVAVQAILERRDLDPCEGP